MADQSKVWIMAEGLRPGGGGGAAYWREATAAGAGPRADALKKFAASCAGLTLEESLDRVATFFGATWQYSDGWILLKRRSVEGLEAASQSASSSHEESGRRG